MRRLERQMQAASARAGLRDAPPGCRDDLGALQRALEKNAVVLPDGTDADVVRHRRGRARGRGPGLPRARRPGPRAARVRGGEGRGPRRHRPDLPSSALLQQLYGELRTPPRRSRARCWCRALPHDPDAVEPLAERHARRRGRRAGPAARRQAGPAGDRARNAEQSLALHKMRRAGDLTTRSRALEELRTRWSCRRPAADRVLRHLQPAGHRRRGLAWWSSRTACPASPTTAASRSAAPTGTDDTAAMAEVRHGGASAACCRRAEAAPGPARPTRRSRPASRDAFALPALLVMSTAGAPQVRRRAGCAAGARDRRHARGRAGQAAGGGVAAGRRRPRDPAARAARALYLLQRIRDEAHRFAITSPPAASARRASRRASLDDVPGLGPARRRPPAASLRLGQAGARPPRVEELATVPGIGPALAAVDATPRSHPARLGG